MKKRWNGILSGIVLALPDILIIFAIFVCVGTIFQNDSTGFFGIGSMKVAAVFVFTDLAAAAFLNMYKITFRKKSEVIMCEIIAGVTAGFAAIVYAVADKKYDFTQPAIQYTAIISIFLSVIVLCFWRILFDYLLQLQNRKTKLLVICGNEKPNIKERYSGQKWCDTSYIHISDSFVDIDEYDSILITQSVSDELKHKILEDTIKKNKAVYVEPNMYEINLTRYELVQFDDVPVFYIKPFEISVYQKGIKRFFDVILSFIGLIIMSPVMLITALAIKCDSVGSIIYKQERVTIDKKRFNIYKFRTMIEDAEKEEGPKLAEQGDKRITRVGKILRAWRIDELPQLFNILKGDMSIVGPRPERPVFVDEFSEKYRGYDNRFIVKAGLTGYAQTYGKYDTDVKDKLLYDLLYIREYSLALDLKIIFLTLKTVLSHNG